jgi:hypothetical protein
VWQKLGPQPGDACTIKYNLGAAWTIKYNTRASELAESENDDGNVIFLEYILSYRYP